MKEIVFRHEDEVDTSKPCEVAGEYLEAYPSGIKTVLDLTEGRKWPSGIAKYFGPLKIELPEPLPPKPELVCLERTLPGNHDGSHAIVGEIRWGYATSPENYEVIGCGRVTNNWASDACKIISR